LSRSRPVAASPEVVVDAEYELVLNRVCSVDVAKAFGAVCVRTPPGEGKPRKSVTYNVDATLSEVTAFAEKLVAQRIEKVTLESTGDYWRIWFYVLEDAGLDVQLVNARDVKNVPGRPKTDKNDAIWLAKLTERGMVRPSFVPPAPQRELRDYTRMRVDLVRDRGRYWQRLEKLLEDALIKVSSVVSTMDLVSVRDMLDALIAGERDPRKLAGYARSRMRSKHAELVKALDGRFDRHHADLASMLLRQIDALTLEIEKLDTAIEACLERITVTFPDDHGEGPGDGGGGSGGGDGPAVRTLTAVDAVRRLVEIPGIKHVNACTLIAEIGLDMTRFPTPEHLVSWMKLCPQTRQSGKKDRKGKCGKGNPYGKGALGIAAAGAARTDTFLGDRFRRVVKRAGKGKALVAVSRSILVIIWHLLSDPNARYEDLGSDYHTKRINTDRKVRSHINQLTALGFYVTLAPISA